MNFKHFCAIILVIVLASSCRSGESYISINGFAQGGGYMVKLNLEEAPEEYKQNPEKIQAGIDSILTVVDNSLSGYNKGSLLSRFNAGETIVPDDIFIVIYDISYEFYELTDGAFDVAAGPLFDVWGFGFRDGSFPSDEEVAAIRAECGMGRLKSDMESAIAEDGSLNPRDLLLEHSDGARLPLLNYNAIAQGYSCDLVAEYLYSLGIVDMLVMVGGEIFCDGVNPSGQPWNIGVDKPLDGNNEMGSMLEGVVSSEGKPRGIVTSGNYRKFYVKDGKKYAHTLDPRTGYPVSHSLLSATIIAPDGATADALATYCMVIGLEGAEDFINSQPDIDGYFIYDTGSPADSLGRWSSVDVR